MALPIAISSSAAEMGLNPLKEKQLEAVMAFLGGRDTFVSLPTGYGKSIVYAILPLVFDKIRGRTSTEMELRVSRGCFNHVLVTVYIGTRGSIVVCVTPLTAIMLDQKAKFTPRGLKAEFVGEAQDDPQSIKAVVEGLAQLVYISPESLVENVVYRRMLLSTPYIKEEPCCPGSR